MSLDFRDKPAREVLGAILAKARRAEVEGHPQGGLHARTPDGLGTKGFIPVLFLLEKATLEELSAAAEDATSLGIADPDTIRSG